MIVHEWLTCRTATGTKESFVNSLVEGEGPFETAVVTGRVSDNRDFLSGLLASTDLAH